MYEAFLTSFLISISTKSLATDTEKGFKQTFCLISAPVGNDKVTILGVAGNTSRKDDRKTSSGSKTSTESAGRSAKPFNNVFSRKLKFLLAKIARL